MSAWGEIERPAVGDITPVSCCGDRGQRECPPFSSASLIDLIFQALRLGLGDGTKAAMLQGNG